MRVLAGALPRIAGALERAAASRLAAAPRVDVERLFEEAEAGDRVAIEVRNRCLRIWAAGAVSMIHAWDPEVLVVGGGVMRNARAVLPFVQEHVRRLAWTPWGQVTVRAAERGEQAALLGAVPLVAGAGG
jgi:glucokinase